MRHGDHDIIRECVQTLLLEDGVGADWAINIKPGRLYDTFVNPWLDVFRTARLETERMSASLQRLVRTTFEAIVSTAIPFMSAEYDKIKAQERLQLERIDTKYADVIKRVQVGFDFPDLQLALLSRSPAAYLAGKIAIMSPEIGREVVGTLSGRAINTRRRIHLGTGNITDVPAFSDYDPWVESSVHDGASLLTELRVDQKKLVALLNSSSILKKMRVAALRVRQHSLQGVIQRAESVSKARTFDDLTGSLGQARINSSHDMNSAQAQVALQMTKSAILGRLVEMLRRDPQVKEVGPDVKVLYDKAIRQIANMG